MRDVLHRLQVYNVVGRTPSEKLFKSPVHPDQLGYVNQRGLSRKVRKFTVSAYDDVILCPVCL